MKYTATILAQRLADIVQRICTSYSLIFHFYHLYTICGTAGTAATAATTLQPVELLNSDSNACTQQCSLLCKDHHRFQGTPFCTAAWVL
jgi:hypothetical protein